MRNAVLRAPVIQKVSVEFRRTGATAYDPLTDSSTPGATLSASSTAVPVVPSSAERARYEQNGWKVQNTLVLDVDAWMLGTFVPTADDQLLFGSLTFAVREVGPTLMGGVTDSYRILATR